MRDQGREDLRIKDISQDGKKEKYRKKQHIECEDHYGNPIEPASIVGQGVKQDRDDPRTHINGKPPIDQSAH